MPAFNFTVFTEKVRSGEKRQTIRKPRKRTPRVGQTAYLYRGMRTKDCEKLGEAKITDVEFRKWGDMKNDRELAIRDGFDGLSAFREWFQRYDPDDDTEFMIVRWDEVEAG